MNRHERAVELVRREAVHFRGRVRYVEGMLEAGAMFPPVSESSRHVADAWDYALKALEAARGVKPWMPQLCRSLHSVLRNSIINPTGLDRVADLLQAILDAKGKGDE